MAQHKKRNRLFTEIMEADDNDRLSYTIPQQNINTVNFTQKKAVGWYCIGHAVFNNTIAFATYYKPNAIKRFFMRTLLDFYWIKNENK